MAFNEPSQIGDFLFAFLGILFEGAPYILLGTIISGFIDAYLPSNIMDRFLPKNRYFAIIISGLLGAIFPVCECAIVPVIRRLVQKGLPVFLYLKVFWYILINKCGVLRVQKPRSHGIERFWSLPK